MEDSIKIDDLGVPLFLETPSCMWISQHSLRKSTVPPEKLLVFDVKEGWEPLCKFLNKPIPDEPFPNINDREKIRAEMNKTLIICYTAQLLRLLTVVGGCGAFYWLVRKFI